MPSTVGASAHLRLGAPWVLALALVACAAPAPVGTAPEGPGAKVQVSAQWPADQWPVKGYGLKGAGFAEAGLRELRLEVFHADASGTPVSDGVATVATAGGVPTGRLNLAVIPGPNRWAHLAGLDAQGQPLASLSSAVSLVDGSSFELAFDGVSHATGRAIAAWKPSGANLTDPDQVARVRAYIQRATGFSAGPNTHTGPNPYAFRAQALGDAAATSAAFLDNAPLPEHLVEGWARLSVVATANGRPLEAGAFTFTLYDPTSTGERLAPGGSVFPRVAPGAWAYRLESASGTVWGMALLGEGQDVALSVPVDAPVVGLGPQAGALTPLLGRPAFGSSWWSTGGVDPVARGVVVGQAEDGASEAFALVLANDPISGVGAQGAPVPLAQLAQRAPVAVWGAATPGDTAIVAMNAQGRLGQFKTNEANLDAGTVAFLGELPATTPVAPGPGQVAVAAGAGRIHILHRSGREAVLTPFGGDPVALRLPFAASQVALTVVNDGPWVAVEMEATGGQRVVVDGPVNEATGDLGASAWHLGAPGEDLGAPSLADVGASTVALAYQKQVGPAVQVAYTFRNDLGASTPEAFLPPSPAMDQLMPQLQAAGPGSPPWVQLVERPTGMPGGATRLRLGQLGAPNLVMADQGLAVLPLSGQLLPVDAPMMPGLAGQWAFAFHLPGQGPVLRPVARPLMPGTALPVLAF